MFTACAGAESGANEARDASAEARARRKLRAIARTLRACAPVHARTRAETVMQAVREQQCQGCDSARVRTQDAGPSAAKARRRKQLRLGRRRRGAARRAAASALRGALPGILSRPRSRAPARSRTLARSRVSFLKARRVRASKRAPRRGARLEATGGGSDSAPSQPPRPPARKGACRGGGARARLASAAPRRAAPHALLALAAAVPGA